MDKLIAKLKKDGNNQGNTLSARGPNVATSRRANVDPLKVAATGEEKAEGSPTAAEEMARNAATRILNAQREQAKQVLLDMDLFDKFDPENLEKLVEDMQIKTLTLGQSIFKQGSQGHEFYVIVDGKAKVKQKKNPTDPTENGRVLKEMGPGDYFGEMALLNNEPRSASVVVSSEKIDVFCLTRKVFEKINSLNGGNMEEAMKKRAEELVMKVPIFKDIPSDLKQEMVAMMKLVRYDTHHYIFRQDDHAHDFFIIIKGQVKVTIRRSTSVKRWEEEVCRLGAGEYFGELALLSSSKQNKRTANVVATRPVQVMVLTRHYFKKLLAQDGHLLINHSVMRGTKEKEFIKRPSFSTFSMTLDLSKFGIHRLRDICIYMVSSLKNSCYLQLYLRLKSEGESFLEENGWAAILADVVYPKMARTRDESVEFLKRASKRILNKPPANRSEEDLKVLNALTSTNSLRERLLLAWEPHQYLVLCRRMTFERVAAQTYVYRHDDQSVGSYMILRGCVRVLVHDKDSEDITQLRCVSQLKPGDTFGVFESKGLRSATTLAVTDLDLIKVLPNENETLMNSKGGPTSVDSKFQYLQSHRMFADADPYKLYRLAGFVRSQVVQTGFIILQQGEPSNGLYLLVEGAVKIVRQGRFKPAKHQHFGKMTAEEIRRHYSERQYSDKKQLGTKRNIQSKDSIVLTSLGPDSYFGEEALLACCQLGLLSTSALKNRGFVEAGNVVAVTKCKLFVLSLENFKMIEDCIIAYIRKEKQVRDQLRKNQLQRGKAAKKDVDKNCKPQIRGFGEAEIGMVGDVPVSVAQRPVTAKKIAENPLEFILGPSLPATTKKNQRKESLCRPRSAIESRDISRRQSRLPSRRESKAPSRSRSPSVLVVNHDSTPQDTFAMELESKLSELSKKMPGNSTMPDHSSLSQQHTRNKIYAISSPIKPSIAQTPSHQADPVGNFIDYLEPTLPAGLESPSPGALNTKVHRSKHRRSTRTMPSIHRKSPESPSARSRRSSLGTVDISLAETETIAAQSSIHKKAVATKSVPHDGLPKPLIIKSPSTSALPSPELSDSEVSPKPCSPSQKNHTQMSDTKPKRRSSKSVNRSWSGSSLKPQSLGCAANKAQQQHYRRPSSTKKGKVPRPKTPCAVEQQSIYIYDFKEGVDSSSKVVSRPLSPQQQRLHSTRSSSSRFFSSVQNTPAHKGSGYPTSRSKREATQTPTSRPATSPSPHGFAQTPSSHCTPSHRPSTSPSPHGFSQATPSSMGFSKHSRSSPSHLGFLQSPVGMLQTPNGQSTRRYSRAFFPSEGDLDGFSQNPSTHNSPRRSPQATSKSKRQFTYDDDQSVRSEDYREMVAQITLLKQDNMIHEKNILKSLKGATGETRPRHLEGFEEVIGKSKAEEAQRKHGLNKMHRYFPSKGFQHSVCAASFVGRPDHWTSGKQKETQRQRVSSASPRSNLSLTLTQEPSHQIDSRGTNIPDSPAVLKQTALMKLTEKSEVDRRNSSLIGGGYNSTKPPSPRRRQKSIVASLSSDEVYIPNKRERASLAYLMNDNALSKEGRKVLSPVTR